MGQPITVAKNCADRDRQGRGRGRGRDRKMERWNYKEVERGIKVKGGRIEIDRKR